jgi:hypothetical protein
MRSLKVSALYHSGFGRRACSVTDITSRVVGIVNSEPAVLKSQVNSRCKEIGISVHHGDGAKAKPPLSRHSILQALPLYPLLTVFLSDKRPCFRP